MTDGESLLPSFEVRPAFHIHRCASYCLPARALKTL